MRYDRCGVDTYIPDGAPMPQALARTTHLCIGAHQDDQEFMALHGILECYGIPNKWFTGICLTNGGGSSRTGIYADYSDEDMMAVRRQEQRKAAFVGDYACQIQLGHPSSELKTPAAHTVIDELTEILDASRPEIAYLHTPTDKHDTHVAAVLRSIAALRALPRNARPRKVYGCEIWRSLDWLHDTDKQVLPVDLHPNLSAALSAVFDSQITGGKRYDTAIQGRRMANATFFESHATDKNTALSWAMDLTPLVHDPKLSIPEYTRSLIDRFAGDVDTRIARFSH